MTEGMVIRLFQEALFYTIIVSAPMLIVSIVVGLVISIFQTATSIQEQTITFVPKILAVLIVTGVCATWLGNVMAEFTIRVFELIPQVLVR
ncbi:flagellar biosynthesis protein FliQ [bacterium]|nr:flagellar biosynthesis protein FliQ [bacterium]MBU1599416.1 flagellar biosynthesis protein FliQ [bacterium]